LPAQRVPAFLLPGVSHTLSGRLDRAAAGP
jgi:hypothetical protein